MTEPPVLVAVERSGVVESAHRGHVVIVDADGEIVHAEGDGEAIIYPRSAVKPLQAAAMLEAGLELAGSQLAIGCASHSGEAFHLRAVTQMLESAGLSVADLQCPADWPLNPLAQREYIAAGGVAAPVAMNCSGKHAAMLLTCQARDWPIDSYLAPEHPLQQALRHSVERAVGGIEMTSTDGCGAPLWGMRLAGLARAFVNLPQSAPQVFEAMTRHPEYVGGTTRDVTALMRGVPGLVTKDGAEAVQAISVDVDGRRYGIALKVVDGGDRARPIIAAAALRWLGVQAPVVEELSQSAVLGGGRVMGEIGLAPGAFV